MINTSQQSATRFLSQGDLESIFNLADESGKKLDRSEIVQEYVNRGYTIEGLNTPKKEQGFFSRVGDSFSSIPERLMRSFGSDEVREGREETSKGFDVADLPGDIADVVGPAIPAVTGLAGTVAGGLAGGGFASAVTGVAGAAVGVGAGEAFRQHVGDTFNVDERFGSGESENEVGGLDLGEVGEAALIEGVGGAVGLGVGKLAVKVGKPALGKLGRSLRNVFKNVTSGIDDAARVAKLPPSLRKAVNSGMDEKLVHFIDDATDGDKAVFREALNVAKQAGEEANPKVLPRVTMGRSVVKRGEALIKHRDKVGGRLGKFSKKFAGENIDITDDYARFVQRLSDRGVELRPNGTVRSIGSLPDGDVKVVQDILNELRPDNNGRVIRKFGRADALRKKWFKEFKLAKANQNIRSDDAVSIMNDARSLLLDNMDRVAPGFRESTEEYAKTTEPLFKLLDALDVKGDVDNIAAKELKGGEIGRRLMGNSSSKVSEVFEAVESRLEELGVDVGGDLRDQAFFADVMEEYFRLTGRTTLAGQAKLGAIETMDLAGGKNMKINTVQQFARSLSSVPREDVIKALENLLGQ